jgi:hypothetical protein
MGTLGQVRIRGGRGDRQHRADRLARMFTPMVFDEPDHLFDRQSIFAIAKSARVLRRIPFA